MVLRFCTNLLDTRGHVLLGDFNTMKHGSFYKSVFLILYTCINDTAHL